MLRLALALIALLSLAPGSSFAESAAPHSPPPRLERPPPRPQASEAPFAPSLAASIRLQALSLSLADLALREKSRFLPGSLQIGFGVGFGTAAVFVHNPGLRAAFTLASAVSGVRGVLSLALRAKVAPVADAFAAIEPSDKPALLRKLHLGELGLAQAARMGKTQRLLEGSVGIAGAVAYLPVQFAFARHADSGHRFGTTSGDYVGLSLSLIGLASSLVQAIMKSPAERHYQEYRALRRATMQLP